MHLRVVGGFEGIDFTKSLYFKDGSDDIILVADYKVRLIRLFEHDIEFHFVQRAVTKAWMAGGLAADKDTKTSVVTGDKLSDLTGDALRAKIVEEYGEGAVLEVEKAYPGETGNWKYDDWRYHMYLYAASDPTEGASEWETEPRIESETQSETEKETVTEAQTTGNSSFTGMLRGEEVTLNDVNIQEIIIIKRSSAEVEQMRKKFNSSVRKNFLMDLGKQPEYLKNAGFTDEEILVIQRGYLPKGWQVHHKIPLEMGGTNDFSNLVLIQNEPYHKVFTNYQKQVMYGMKEGNTVKVTWPQPNGNIYPRTH